MHTNLQWVGVFINYLTFSDLFCKYPNAMVGVALYSRFYIMYTSVYLHNMHKKKACGLVVASPALLTREKLKGMIWSFIIGGNVKLLVSIFVYDYQ